MTCARAMPSDSALAARECSYSNHVCHSRPDWVSDWQIVSTKNQTMNILGFVSTSGLHHSRRLLYFFLLFVCFVFFLFLKQPLNHTAVLSSGLHKDGLGPDVPRANLWAQHTRKRKQGRVCWWFKFTKSFSNMQSYSTQFLWMWLTHIYIVFKLVRSSLNPFLPQLYWEKKTSTQQYDYNQYPEGWQVQRILTEIAESYASTPA